MPVGRMLSSYVKLCHVLIKLKKFECIFIMIVHFLWIVLGIVVGFVYLWESANLCNLVNYSQNHVDLLVNDESGPWRFTGFYSFPEENLHRQS